MAVIALLGRFYESNFRSSIFKLKKFKSVLECVYDKLTEVKQILAWQFIYIKPVSNAKSISCSPCRVLPLHAHTVWTYTSTRRTPIDQLPEDGLCHLNLYLTRRPIRVSHRGLQIFTFSVRTFFFSTITRLISWH